MSGQEKVVIISLGNRFRGDDGIGPVVADRMKTNAARHPDGTIAGCTLAEGTGDAMALVSAWEGAALAVVIDAAVSGTAPGTVRRMEAGTEALPKDLARCSSHGLGLSEAVELGKALERLPGRLVIFAVEAATFEQGAAMSQEVAAAADEVVRNVESEIVSFMEDRKTRTSESKA